MTEGYIIAGVIVIICIGAIIFAIGALNETRDLSSNLNEPDSTREEK